MPVYDYHNPPTTRAHCPQEPYHPAPEISPEELSDRDLLVALVSRASAARLGPLPPNGLLDLLGLSIPAIMDTLGLTASAARKVALAVELHRRILRSQIPDRPRIRAPEDVLRVMAPWEDLDHERFWCLPLDSRSRLIGDPIMVSAGDIDGTEAGPRSFFRGALRCGAHRAVAAHNHPSGDASPSPQDRAITKRLAAAGKLLDIALTDHVIIAPRGNCHSMRRQDPELFRSGS